MKYDGNIVLRGGADIFNYYSIDYVLDEELFKKDSFDNLVGNVGILSDNIDELIAAVNGRIDGLDFTAVGGDVVVKSQIDSDGEYGGNIEADKNIKAGGDI